MDTLSSNFETKPGADDDGSGSVTVLELARTIIASNMRFKKPIYFIWYAAEEMGLVGSQYVVTDFVNKKIPVDAVVQFDMTGYAYHNESTMWLMTDHVDTNLTHYLETLINTYVKKPVKYSACGYGCSDHASWDAEGFAASMPFETEMNYDNPDIHTSADVMANLSLDHMTDYLKLGTAFVVELAEPLA
jgi:leucyl aminopeptidase